MNKNTNGNENERVWQERERYLINMLEDYWGMPAKVISNDRIHQFLILKEILPNSTDFRIIQFYYWRNSISRRIFKQLIAADSVKNLSNATANTQPIINNFLEPGLTDIGAKKSEEKISQEEIFPGYRKFMDNLKIRRYSAETLKAYRRAIRHFHLYLQKNFQTGIEEVNNEYFQSYMYYIVETRQLSYSAQKIASAAIMYYCRSVLGKTIPLDAVRYIRKSKNLPKVITRMEVVAILSKLENRKHRLGVGLLYGCGLRVSEAVNVHVEDLDLLNNTLRVREGKGKKDRITVLSPSLLPDIDVLINGKLGADFLIHSGNDFDIPLSVRSLQKAFEKAVVAAGLNKKVTCHHLRHSFATHLLEQGVDIRYIQKLLGHRNITTTTIYTLVENRQLLKIISPL